MKLRPYQQDTLDCGFEMMRDHQSVLCTLATGLGKGVIISHAAERMLKLYPDKIVMVFVNRKKIVQQLYAHCSRNKHRHIAIEMGEHHVNMNDLLRPNIIVGTTQTQASGGDGLGRMAKVPPELVSLVIGDEIHNFHTVSGRRVLNYYLSNPECKLMGFTATPKRHDGKAMGVIFETATRAYDIEWAVDNGWLVKPLQYMATVANLDISHVGTVAGDFNAGELERELVKDKPNYEIATVAIQASHEMKTLVFAVGVEQASRLTDVLNSMKPDSARYVCGKTPDEERDKLYDDFYHKRFQFLVSVGVLLEGFDDPGVECIVDAAMTKSIARYTQKVGRGLRPAESIAHTLNDCADESERIALIDASEKRTLTYIDMVGNSGRHKLVSIADILGGDYSEEVRQRAKATAKKAGERGEAVDMADVLAKADAELKREKERQSVRRAKLKAKAEYRLEQIDPFNVYDIRKSAPASTQPTERGKLSDKQRAILEKQGIRNIDAMPYADAKALIDRIAYGWQHGLASYKQTMQLRRFGYPAMPFTREQAHNLLNAEFSKRQAWRTKA